MLDPRQIQTALQERTALAIRAARLNALPGDFESWECDGVFANRASDPELGFLSTIVSPEPSAVDHLRTVFDDPRWGAAPPAIVLYGDPEPAIQAFLTEGFTGAGWRPVAVRNLSCRGRETTESPPSEAFQVEAVADNGLDEFLAVLLDAYRVEGAITKFIESEHRDPQLQRFAVRDDGRLIAVAGMTIHGNIAVLGGAATLPADRGRGAQAVLLRRRLHVARQAGCVWAVATAAHQSPSARNLERLGFTVWERPSWRKSG